MEPILSLFHSNIFITPFLCYLSGPTMPLLYPEITVGLTQGISKERLYRKDSCRSLSARMTSFVYGGRENEFVGRKTTFRKKA
jgi:hypothetical protein